MRWTGLGTTLVVVGAACGCFAAQGSEDEVLLQLGSVPGLQVVRSEPMFRDPDERSGFFATIVDVRAAEHEATLLVSMGSHDCSRSIELMSVDRMGLRCGSWVPGIRLCRNGPLGERIAGFHDLPAAFERYSSVARTWLIEPGQEPRNDLRCTAIQHRRRS